MTDLDARLIDKWQHQLGDDIRAGKTFVVANPEQGWAIDMVERHQRDWDIIHGHATAAGKDD